MDQRFETLESKLAHLEMTVEQLNQVVFEQSKQLDVAQKQIQNLQSRLNEVLETSEIQPHSIEAEKPPHY